MSAETRERVLEAIRVLGYRPGVAPSVAAARRPRTIGVFLYFWVSEETPFRSNPYAVEMLDGILSHTLPRHWNVTLINVDTWEDARFQLRESADGRCDGFVLVAPTNYQNITEALQERGYPFVLVNAGAGDSQLNSVDIDNTEAAREVTARLIGLGHRRIAFLPGNEELENTVERLRGFRQAFADAGLTDPDRWILRPGSYDDAQSIERVHHFLDERSGRHVEEQPHALICGNDLLARLAYAVFEERGVRIPEEMSVVGFDDLPFAPEMTPPLSTVRQPLRRLSARATERLLDRLAEIDEAAKAGEAVGMLPAPVTEFLPHEVIFRGSVAARHGADE